MSAKLSNLNELSNILMKKENKSRIVPLKLKINTLSAQTLCHRLLSLKFGK